MIPTNSKILSEKKTNLILNECNSLIKGKREESINFSHFNSKDNCPKFKLSKELTQEQRKLLHTSLFRALNVKSIKFMDDLCFLDPDCPPSMNDARKEPSIQLISNYNKEIYYKFKEKTRIGDYPSIEVIDDEVQVSLFK
jgi:hypothetical protein